MRAQRRYSLRETSYPGPGREPLGHAERACARLPSGSVLIIREIPLRLACSRLTARVAAAGGVYKSVVQERAISREFAVGAVRCCADARTALGQSLRCESLMFVFIRLFGFGKLRKFLMFQLLFITLGGVL